MNPLLSFAQALLKPVSDMYGARQETKQAETTGKQKIKAAQLDAESKLDLTDAEYEVVLAKGLPSSWKDEYLTIIITLPIPLILIGAILQAYNPVYTELLQGTIEGIKAINNLEGTMADMIAAVVYAGIGLKLWRNT